MPNKRKKGKRIVAAWLAETEFARLDALAKKLRIPRSKLVEECVRRGLGAPPEK